MIIITCEILLIQLGIILEVIAYLRSKEALPVENANLAAATPEEEEPAREKMALTVPQFTPIGTMPKASKPRTLAESYRMEDVPAGVRPADLLRTAKVHYFKKFSD
jgi:hypothetical protein